MIKNGNIKKCLFWFLLILLSPIFSSPCFSPYQSGKTYISGDKVSYQGKNYEAKWWTLNIIPGSQKWDGDWKEIGVCTEEIIIDLSTEKQQEQTTAYDMSQFVLYAKSKVSIASSAKITGNIGSLGSVGVAEVSAAWATIIKGDIYSKQTKFGYDVTHNGKIFNYCDTFDIPVKQLPSATQKVNGKWKENVSVSAGNYKEISVNDGGSLTMARGVYNINNLNFNSNDISININLNLAAGDFVEINADSVKFGSGMKVQFANKKSPLSFTLYTNQKELIIPDKSEFNGIIIAPNAKVTVNSDTRINGAIFAKEISVGYNVVINQIPMLNDIFHSQYNFAPKFSPIHTQYFSVISNDANIEFVEGITSKGQKAKVTNEMLDNYILSLEDSASGIVSYYRIKFERVFSDYAIFVDAIAKGNGSGTSWADAVNNIQKAVELAYKTGKEIRVAQGTYPKAVIGQGIKILGGFTGIENNEKPQGSPYRTILDGNKQGQTVQIIGFENAKSVKIKGLTIQNGNSQTVGGGIYSKNVSPKIEECVIQNNTAKEDGAGIYAGSGVQDLHMVLVEQNTGKSAFYLGNGDLLKAERVVISQNTGVGFAIKNSKINFVNSIFYGNDTALTADNSQIGIIHCTSAKNRGGAVSRSSSVKALNSIFYNDAGKEFIGDGIDVKYSCVKTAVSGEGNITGDPLFVDVNKPKGSDEEFGTDDDGLRLKAESKCIDAVEADSSIQYDIIETLRPIGAKSDMGAYEYYFLPKIELPSDFLGYLDSNGQFQYSSIRPRVFTDIKYVREIEFASKTNRAKYVRIEIPKKRRTNIGRFHAEVIGIDDSGKPLDKAKKISVWFYKKGTQGDNYVFVSNKPIVFIDNPRLQGEYDFCYAMLMNNSAKIHYDLDRSQF